MEYQEDGVTIYVVAWRYDGGGGFDWYYTELDALKAFEVEKRNARELVSCGWVAFYFPIKLESLTLATDEIDGDLDGLCNRAIFVYPDQKVCV